MDGLVLRWLIFLGISLFGILLCSWLAWQAHQRANRRRTEALRRRYAREMEDGDDDWEF